jgi:hypothetical protein
MDRQAVLRYLPGQLSEDEKPAVERGYLDGPDSLEFVEIVEDGLIGRSLRESFPAKISGVSGNPIFTRRSAGGSSGLPLRFLNRSGRSRGRRPRRMRFQPWPQAC